MHENRWVNVDIEEESSKTVTFHNVVCVNEEVNVSLQSCNGSPNLEVYQTSAGAVLGLDGSFEGSKFQGGVESS